jgi:ElaB/YqjD/DUF883 family membrane-anchored ribosome-binding protein
MNAADQTTTPTGDGLAAAAARIAEELQRAKDNLSRSASDASGELADELRKLQDDLAAIQRTVAGFGYEARTEAAGAASRIGGHAAGAAHEFADSAKQQAHSAMADFEEFARKNPQVVLGATLGLGVIIGLMLRRR